MNKRMFFLFAVLMFGLILVEETKAQTTIMNAPSTDVTPEKKTYVEFDFLTFPARQINGGFQTYNWRVVYGLKKKFEIGLNGSRTELIDPKPVVEFQPNAKWQFYNNEDKGVAATVGGIMFIPANKRPGKDTFGMLYFNSSKRVKANYGPRFTGGFYGLVGRNKGLGPKLGVIAAIEQPIHKKAMFVIDYFSGKNRFGYVTPGFMLAATNKTTFAAGYSFGNFGRRNNALFLFIGHTF